MELLPTPRMWGQNKKLHGMWTTIGCVGVPESPTSRILAVATSSSNAIVVGRRQATQAQKQTQARLVIKSQNMQTALYATESWGGCLISDSDVDDAMRYQVGFAAISVQGAYRLHETRVFEYVGVN